MVLSQEIGVDTPHFLFALSIFGETSIEKTSHTGVGMRWSTIMLKASLHQKTNR
jgi:hypothetical protein